MADIHSILKQHWGYGSFRPLQEDIIGSVMQGYDTLALMPTGGGKSICFQVPALANDGLCIVVSPLIALMKDQVHNLKKRDINAAAIHSGMGRHEMERNLNNCIHGHTKLLYLSPERLKTDIFRAQLPQMNVNLVAIDEAHCVSQWGYDFRPPYLQIAELRQILPNIPFLALTASATPTVQDDICEKLGFKPDAKRFKKSFARPNLSYSVFHEEAKVRKLLLILNRVGGTGIVYVRNRKRTAEFAGILRKNNIKADHYHAGLDTKTRSRKQEDWMAGKTRIMVCTNAFGMGIDKPDVRTIVHMDLPDSLEAYYQEAGRAGRDLKRSYAALLYNEADHKSLLENFEHSYPPPETVRQTYNALGNHFQCAIGAGEGQDFEFDLRNFCHQYGLRPLQVHASIKLLAQSGYLLANEGLHNPSRMTFLLDKSELYRFEIANKRLEPYIKTLLRTYGGIMHNYVDIFEEELARNLQCQVQYVTNALGVLKQQKVADYVPRRNKPFITYLRPRVAAERLMLDSKLFEFRKKVQGGNINAVIAYTENGKVCRSRQLVGWFGEKGSPDCESCDVCIEKKRKAKESERFGKIAELVKTTLKPKSASLEKLVEAIPQFPADEVIKVVRWMLDNGQLRASKERELMLEM